MTDAFSMAINSFKFAKALVTGDVEGMKAAAKAIALDMGGDQVLKAINAVKMIASGDVMGGLRDLTQVALEVTPLGGTPIGIVMGGALSLMDAYEEGGLKGLGMAALTMSPVGNVAQTAFAVKAGVDEGGAGGGAVAFLKTTSVGGRVDGMIEMGEAAVNGDVVSAGGYAKSYGNSVVGDKIGEYKQFGSDVATNAGGMAFGYVKDSVMSSNTVSGVQSFVSTNPMEWGKDKATSALSYTSSSAASKVERPSLAGATVQNSVENGVWTKINKPFDRFLSAANTMESKIDGFVDAPFLRVESAISSAESKVLGVLEKPELFFAKHVTGRVDGAVAHMDDKFARVVMKVEKPVDDAFMKLDDTVQTGVSKAMAPIKKVQDDVEAKAQDIFKKDRPWKKPSATPEPAASTASTGPNARTSSQRRSEEPEDTATPGASVPNGAFSLSSNSISAMVAAYRKDPPQLAWA